MPITDDQLQTWIADFSCDKEQRKAFFIFCLEIGEKEQFKTAYKFAIEFLDLLLEENGHDEIIQRQREILEKEKDRLDRHWDTLQLSISQ